MVARRQGGAQIGRMRVLLLPALIATVVLAQPRPPTAFPRDGGLGGDAGSSARPAAASDAGVAAAAPAPVDRGSFAEVMQLRKDLADLRSRVSELERQNQDTQRQRSSEVDRLGKELEALKAQVSGLSQAEEKRGTAETALADQRAATATATTNLNGVLSQLSTGNTRGLEPSLQYAEQSFTGDAQRLVQLARQALAQGDLNNARRYLMLAINEANAPQR